MTGREGPEQEYRRALDVLARTLPQGWASRVRAGRPIAWRIFTAPVRLPAQGWKLHVSSAAADGLDLVERVLAELVGLGVTFKVPARLAGFVQINAGQAGPTQIGKIVTVYPVDSPQLRQVVERLEPLWRPSRAPAVPTDLAVAPALSIRYGAFTVAEVVVDQVGIARSALVTPDGRRCPDVGETPGWAYPAPLPASPPRVPDPMAVITAGGERFLPVRALSIKPGGRVVLGLRLADPRLVVIRSAVWGVEGDASGRDAWSRLDNERDILLRLRGTGLAPDLIAHDTEGGHLVVSDVEGTPFVGPDQLVPLAREVARLHAHGVVHRDLKLANVRFAAGRVRLVDFEAAAPIGTPDPLPSGTQGYVPPEGRGAPARPAYDVYALGSCITHALLAHCPGSLPEPGNAGRQIGLLKLRGRHGEARIVRQAHHPDPARRPSAADLADQLAGLRQDPPRPPAVRADPRQDTPRRPAVQADLRQDTPHPLAVRADLRWARAAAIDAGLATRHFLTEDRTGHYWRNAHLLSAYACEGVNLGAAGIIIGLSSLDAALGTAQFDQDVLGAAEWLAARPPAAEAHGLFTGNSGVAVALALAGRRHHRASLISAARERFERASAARAPDYDLFSGAAGIVWGACLLHAVLSDPWPLEAAERQVERILRAADPATGWPAGPAYDPKGRVYLGAAHGTAGIALALAAWARAAGDDRALAAAQNAFDGLPTGPRTPATSAGDVVRPAHHWCHGTAGHLWCLLQAFPDRAPAYGLDAPAPDNATMLLDVPGPDHSTMRLDVPGPDHATVRLDAPVLDNTTMCHGLAGVLELRRMRGGDCADLMATLRLLHQTYRGNTVWGADQPSVTPDLWVGLLGPAVQLALLAAGRAEPLLSPRWLKIMKDAHAPGNGPA